MRRSSWSLSPVKFHDWAGCAQGVVGDTILLLFSVSVARICIERVSEVGDKALDELLTPSSIFTESPGN